MILYLKNSIRYSIILTMTNEAATYITPQAIAAIAYGIAAFVILGSTALVILMMNSASRSHGRKAGGKDQ